MRSTRVQFGRCLVLAGVGAVFAFPAMAQELQFTAGTKFNGSFDVIYSRGSFVPQAAPAGPIRPDTGQLALDGSYTDMARIGRATLGLEHRLTELGSIRINGTLFSSDIADQPLTPNDYADYTAFLRQRWLGGTPLWSRPFLLGDVEFRLSDPRLPGSELIFGQQWLPFGYVDTKTILPPIAISPQHTPLAEYVNGQRLAANLVPWQPSLATRQRQIGSTVKANYDQIMVTTGVYTGAGPTQADNNGALDFLLRADWHNEQVEAGISYWRGTEPGFRTRDAASIPFDRNVFGLHARLPYEQFALTGEYTLYFQGWHDGVASNGRGGYLTLTYAPDLYSHFALQGSYVQHDNPSDGALADMGGYINRQATLSYKRRIGDYADWQTEFAYTWEDLDGPQATGVPSSQFLSKVRVGF